MRLRHLDVFIAVIREGTATGAAEALNTTQPNITKILKQLEYSYGMRLFERSGGRLHPTAEAHALFDRAEHVRNEISSLDRFARSLSRLESGFLRIATQPSYSNAILPLAVSRFRQEYPLIRVQVDVLGRDAIAKLDENSPVDVAFVHYMGDRQPPYVARTISIHPMICIAPKGHPLLNYDAVSVEQALKYPRIGFPPDHISSRLVEQHLDMRPEDLVPDVTVNHTSLATDLVRQGVGIAIVEPVSFDETRLHGVELRPLVEQLMFKTGLSFPSRRAFSLPAENFLRIVENMI